MSALKFSNLQFTSMTDAWIVSRVRGSLQMSLDSFLQERNISLSDDLVFAMVDYFRGLGVQSERGLTRACALELIAGPEITREQSFADDLSEHPAEADEKIDDLYERLAGVDDDTSEEG